MRILLAEDERSLSRAIIALLERNNYSADAVYDGQEVLAYLEAGNYDALILEDYRYLVSQEADGTRIIFLDCHRSLSSFRITLMASAALSLLGGPDPGHDPQPDRPVHKPPHLWKHHPGSGHL